MAKQGMGDLERIEKRLSMLMTDRIEVLVGKAAEKQLDFMADLNREQLNDGIDSAGQIISPPYAESTRIIKKRQGRPYNKVTLFDEGFYHSSIKATKRGGVFPIEASDKKREDLVDKYGEDIEGLTDENVAKVSQAMIPDLTKSSLNYLLS